MAKYFIVRSDYIGPNDRDSFGDPRGDDSVLTITTDHPETNMSQEKIVYGWMGSFNDTTYYAMGSYDSLDQARLACKDEGYTNSLECDFYGGDLECWVTPESQYAQWDAADWLEDCKPSDFFITAESTDAELEKLADEIEGEAKSEQKIIHGVYELLSLWRSQLEYDAC